MKISMICRRVIGVLFVALLLITWSLALKHHSTSSQSKSNLKSDAVAAINKQDSEKSLYYRYYMILKSRNKMHKV
jgi:hypothetical protein